MSWIESHQSLLSHRKTLRAATKLGISKHLLIGHLHALWWWGLDNASESGHLGEAFPEELAEAAGYASKKATAFVEALVFVKFLEETTSGYVFHNWQRYTWRYYQGKEKKDEASSAGAFGNHKRWHLDRGVIAPDCDLCVGANRGASRGDVAPDVATQSLPTNQPNQPNQPTEQTNTTTPFPMPNRAVVVGFERCFARLLSPMELEEVRALEDEHPADRIEYALREAAALNKRSVRYVQRTCERLATDASESSGGFADEVEDSGRVDYGVPGLDRRSAAVARLGRVGGA